MQSTTTIADNAINDLNNHQSQSRQQNQHTIPILIVGSGSAGLCAATWLCRRQVPYIVLEKRDGPLRVGQADGVQCRTVEVFESFGIEHGLISEGYWVNEIAFWDVGFLPVGDDVNGEVERVKKRGLIRTSRTPDAEPGLSHMPHVILNQARVNGLMLEEMGRWGGAERVEYGWEVKEVKVDGEMNGYPVKVVAFKDGMEHVWRASYVLGCDGAHSVVRRSLGYKMIGDSTDVVWGVLDVYPRTDFPDIRKKATLHADAGNILIIPREGDWLVRFYIQLPPGTVAKEVKLSDLHETARKIFSQYTLEVADTYWWSAYSVGQRLADHFSTEDQRVFLFGDACHTHSPKAGQGMNVSLQDGYNMGWKLAAVYHGQAREDLLLPTYTLERGKTAKDLIDFDREFSKLFAQKASEELAKQFSEQFIKSGRYTAGLTATYDDSIITAAGKSEPGLAKNITVGMRFPSAQVIRFCDTKAIQLVRALPADGRWRIVVFAGDIENTQTRERLHQLAGYLDSHTAPIRKYTKPGADPDSFIEILVVIRGDRTKFEHDQISDFYAPVTDLRKVYFDDEHTNSGHGHAYERYGIDKDKGALVIVRPDHYVSMVIDPENHSIIGDFFDGFCLETTEQRNTTT